MDFIAFDFETANSSRHSICSVGMVFVENGKIVDTVYQLIDPEEKFDGYNIHIHGIRPKDIEGAPTFSQFYDKYKGKIQNKIMVAHYLPFDGYAFRDNLKRYQITPFYNQFLCTYQLSRKLITGQSSYQLNSLCHHFGIELDKHHHALDDAIACANLMMKLTSEYQMSDLNAIYEKTYIKPGEISESGFRSSYTSNGGKLDLRTIKISEDANQDSAFLGKNIAFTGKLNVFTRKEAAELVANNGGSPQNNVTKETDYIIIGNFEDVMIKGNKSSKLKKAEKMVNEGKELEIIGEEDFLKML